MHRSFSFTGYWLNSPPGEKGNTWTGKRETLKRNGFGFMILFNGRLEAELHGKNAAALGRTDAAAAIAGARREGFPAGAIVFLDQEEGGRLTPEQSDYLFSWIQGIRDSQFKPGVYCNGILVPEGSSKISTALDILSHDRKVAFWVVNDQCPPSPGCVRAGKSLGPGSSGVSEALVWQYSRSPKTEYAGQCPGYAADTQCYVPGLTHSPLTFVDLNVSSSADPSHGR